ncbi:hypothetical protein [Morganella psychrotolerans]|uniref:hypothetical protein n=1 Tax=Morganella psychrotolerans TaxID=368603 RepID=UPI0039AFE44D
MMTFLSCTKLITHRLFKYSVLVWGLTPSESYLKNIYFLYGTTISEIEIRGALFLILLQRMEKQSVNQ